MSLHDTVSAERIHIGFFGRRNAGKSSLVNAVSGQALCIVSEVKGTTTDPVKKAMELLPLGPVLLIDTPGLDDEGTLGKLRVEKAYEALSGIDIAVLVADAVEGLSDEDGALLLHLKQKKTPHLVVYNKSDLLERVPAPRENELYVSALTGAGISALKDRLGAFAETLKTEKKILADLVEPGDTAVLVIPVDAAAPKGRLILPQQQVLRELLDLHCAAVCCQPEELSAVLDGLKKPPRLVVTDSQAFERVAAVTPPEVPLTSFSILFARYKGELELLTAGARALKTLKDGDRVLISEGCTHHRQCGDIGTEKMPAWIRAYANADPTFDFTSGGEFPQDLSPFRLVVHCGGCMLNAAQMHERLRRAEAAGVPVVNYGAAIAAMHGILERSLAVFEK